MNKGPHILIQDGDAHWFLIQEGRKEHFEYLVDIEDWDSLNEEYSKCAIDNPRNLVILDWKTKQ